MPIARGLKGGPGGAYGGHLNLEKLSLIEHASRRAIAIYMEESVKRLGLGTIVAIGLTLPAFGQSSLREQLVGAWALVSCDGSTFPFTAALCTNPNGIHILDASGHYTTVHAARGRAKLTDITRPGTAEEYKAAAVDFRANFGTWSVNEADKTITYHFDGAFAPNVEGTDAKSGTVSVSGDELKIGSQVWRRIKK